MQTPPGPRYHGITMSKPAPKRTTYDDIIALPDNLVGELLDGELYTQPRPASRHAMAASVLTTIILGEFGQGGHGAGGWWILAEPELHLGEDVLVPDLAGWRCVTLPDFPDAAYFTVASDWVCEVLSPSTARKDRFIKRRIYAREGVQHLWFIDPLEETFEAFALDDGQWRVVLEGIGQQMIAAPPFQGFAFDLGRLWVSQ